VGSVLLDTIRNWAAIGLTGGTFVLALVAYRQTRLRRLGWAVLPSTKLPPEEGASGADERHLLVVALVNTRKRLAIAKEDFDGGRPIRLFLVNVPTGSKPKLQSVSLQRFDPENSELEDAHVEVDDAAGNAVVHPLLIPGGHSMVLQLVYSGYAGGELTVRHPLKDIDVKRLNLEIGEISTWGTRGLVVVGFALTLLASGALETVEITKWLFWVGSALLWAGIGFRVLTRTRSRTARESLFGEVS
jgi:hypothetical protein